MDYHDLINRYLLEPVPSQHHFGGIDHFEAVSSVVFGTKQRRCGPMPPPETQVAIRNVIRSALEQSTTHGDYDVSTPTLTLFVPFGSRKQADGYPLDILEYSAIRQLRCLQEGLKVLGVSVQWVFRVEDLADRYLFPGSENQIKEYGNNLSYLVHVMLDSVYFRRESDSYNASDYLALCEAHTLLFEEYLKDGKPYLPAVWKGGISEEQRAEFTRCYAVLYPNQDPVPHMTRYFSTVSARYTLGDGMVPSGEHLTATFHRPRTYPTLRLFLHTRTVPERFTHLHREPWLARGYVTFDENDELTVKIAENFSDSSAVAETYIAKLGEASIRCDFQ